jgi:hypothetical protein
MSDDAIGEFDELRNRAAEAIAGDDVQSLYVGLVHENGDKEYYFGNTVDEEELGQVAAVQLGMMMRVLSTQSATTPEDLADIAVEQAASIDIHPE